MAAEEVSVNLGVTTPRRLLVDWANGQDAWVRQITAETILSRQAPSDALLDAAYGTFLAEKGLGDGETPEIPKLELVAADAAEEETLELVSLTGIQGVNALAADQELEFDPSLTVLFGQNGSGKTGYARILKRISAVRTAEDILPNAHTAYLATPPSPRATIQYRLSDTDSSVVWNNESGLAPFTRISVFDASAVSLHVDSDLATSIRQPSSHCSATSLPGCKVFSSGSQRRPRPWRREATRCCPGSSEARRCIR
ncbi:hypothetical protein AB3M83_01780 [Microbacterium sp. 179-B 1A2 NHS]|uniref:hypothetical protein n=1 Tax=Microbacterium sp. 179-B 1A2 NHS TaxID=3142383 RepID=UPI00399FF074